MQQNDPMAKTIVFCIDQEHASRMRDELWKAAPPEWHEKSDEYIMRITSDDKEGRLKVDDFKEYTKFIFGVLDEYLNVIDADKLKKIKDSKVGEYLAERLTNVFLIKKYTKMKTFPVILTEEKYKKPSQ